MKRIKSGWTLALLVVLELLLIPTIAADSLGGGLGHGKGGIKQANDGMQAHKQQDGKGDYNGAKGGDRKGKGKGYGKDDGNKGNNTELAAITVAQTLTLAEFSLSNVTVTEERKVTEEKTVTDVQTQVQTAARN
ncbi:uncharacterized protein BDZ99DRAFT_478048 [Mytilinidion resinicola]|uniref:Glycine-rich protein n=1 Tax=Mytilinidion resinicola TaxID=574789 RepID=A0A6A6YIF2_9PEZI|nr:uncharacterized protein BDZ99DRAFT_478048 [Mytilinidion resinicola]KAF2808570.1 hypothetical protein BDZ99DRAFT_478048 [Mytilinidion resinicola]